MYVTITCVAINLLIGFSVNYQRLTCAYEEINYTMKHSNSYYKKESNLKDDEEMNLNNSNQQLTPTRFVLIENFAIKNGSHSRFEFQKWLKDDKSFHQSKTRDNNKQRLSRRSNKKKQNHLRHVTSTLQSLVKSTTTPEPEYIGSIHKDTFQRILNESYSITGSTPNSGKISATDPYIDPSTPYKVSAYSGNTAILSCFVNNLGQHSVSWVRHQDIHVLTVGQFTFTNDGRFHSHHEDGSNEWALRLSSPNVNDTGYYECQVNTKPILVRLIFLKVYEPQAVISGGEELYLKLGSTIALQCRIINAPGPSDYLLWYHNKKVCTNLFNALMILSDGDQRTTIEISEEHNETTSVLKISSANIRDSGTYICSRPNAQEAKVKVHVINGEHPAAMQTNSSSRKDLQYFLWIFYLFFVFIWSKDCYSGKDLCSIS